MSENDDKHLDLIKKRGKLSFIERSPERLKKYQTKITKLANSLRRDILQDDVSELFSKSELQSIEQTVAALSRFKNTVAHAKEHAGREQERWRAARDNALKASREAVLAQFPYRDEDYTGKLHFGLAVSLVCGVYQFRESIEDLEHRITEDATAAIKSFPTWVENFYDDRVNLAARMAVGPLSDSLEPGRLSHLLSALNDAMSKVDIRARKTLDAATWYLARTTGSWDTSSENVVVLDPKKKPHRD